jgi:uncharacterized protein YraI
MRQSLLSVLLAAGLLSLAAPAFAAPAITLAEAGFAAGPGADYDIASKLAIGSHVDVIWCGTHENWCLVDFHNKRGWVPMASLTFKVPHAVAMSDGGTPNTGGGAVAGPGARKTSPEAAVLAPEKSPGGGGPVFSPVNPGLIFKP